MTFHLRGDSWVCSFVEKDAKTPVGRARVFGSPEKIRVLIARTPTRLDQAAKQSLEHAFAKGRGGIFLDLNDDQYRKLKG